MPVNTVNIYVNIYTTHGQISISQSGITLTSSAAAVSTLWLPRHPYQHPWPPVCCTAALELTAPHQGIDSHKAGRAAGQRQAGAAVNVDLHQGGAGSQQTVHTCGDNTRRENYFFCFFCWLYLVLYAYTRAPHPVREYSIGSPQPTDTTMTPAAPLPVTVYLTVTAHWPGRPPTLFVGTESYMHANDATTFFAFSATYFAPYSTCVHMQV